MPRRILVTGASVAGTTAAWWLARRGFDVEVVEKASAFRDGGQNVDVRGTARQVLKKMGLEELASSQSTCETGTAFVDERDRTFAEFPVGDADDRGLTAEIEISRGEIARMIYEVAAKHAHFRFGDTIAAVEQDDKGATVTFTSGQYALYDAVIIAEGVGATTRDLVFPNENKPRWMDLTVAYFSAPETSDDGSFSRQYNTVAGRGGLLKPAGNGKMGAYIGIQKKPAGENEWSRDRQKQFIADQFANDGWQFPRLLKVLAATDDFYFDVLRQVRMDRWSASRVVLTGDAAWCPTPVSGIGTTLAIVGSYVLAGEMAKTDVLADAFASYEKIMRPFAKEGQNLPKIVPRLLWPHTKAGLAVLRLVLRIASTRLLRNTVLKRLARNANAIDLPEYAALGAA